MEVTSLNGLEGKRNLLFSTISVILSDLLSLEQQIPGAQTPPGSRADHSDPPQLGCRGVGWYWFSI